MPPTSVTITFEGQKCCPVPEPVEIKSHGVIQWNCSAKKFKVTAIDGNPAHPFGDQFPDPGAGFKSQVSTPPAKPVSSRRQYKYSLAFDDGSSVDPIIIIDQ